MSQNYENKLQMKETQKQIKGPSVIREMKNPKAFANPILTVVSKLHVVRIGIANALGLFSFSNST